MEIKITENCFSDQKNAVLKNAVTAAADSVQFSSMSCLVYGKQAQICAEGCEGVHH